MTHKAKRIDNREWVKGYYERENNIHWLNTEPKNIGYNDIVQIDPSTLCERVRGTDFYEGDEVVNVSGNYYLGTKKGFVEWEQEYLRWMVDGVTMSSQDWKSTGRNKHDL